MKIDNKVKLDIQQFVYFFFKGTLSQKLIKQDFDYINYLIKFPKKIFAVFYFFAENYNLKKYEVIVDDISDMIINDFNKLTQIENLRKENFSNKLDFWQKFTEIAYFFCFSEFLKRVDDFSLVDFEGNGTDALPYFAVWTNIIEVDNDNLVINAEIAKKRANDRLLLWNEKNKDIIKFEDWELKQELY